MKLKEVGRAFRDSMPPISIGNLFNEFSVLNSYLTQCILDEWTKENISLEQRLLTVLAQLKKEETAIPNFKIFIEFVLCLPVTNASVEWAISLINKFWCAEKCSMSIDYVKSMLFKWTVQKVVWKCMRRSEKTVNFWKLLPLKINMNGSKSKYLMMKSRNLTLKN